METFDLIIVGAGPAGLSAAHRAHHRGLKALVLERAGHLADTVHRYQRGKLVTDGPAHLARGSDLPFAEASREQVLDAWRKVAADLSLHIRFRSEVVAVRPSGGDFTVETADGTGFVARNVVFAVGVHGNLNVLDIPGAEWEGVQYELADASLIEGERIAVIGAGDSAIENALALADHNDVVLINRKPDILRATERNRRTMDQRIAAKRIGYMGEARPLEIRPGVLRLETPEGDAEIECDRIVARLGSTPPSGFLAAVGVTLDGDGPDARPRIDTNFQAARPGLYLIGSATGYPMIKHALNQGREVIDHICGDAVISADQPLLETNLGSLMTGGVDETLDRLGRSIPVMREFTPMQLRRLFHQVQVQDHAPGARIFDWGEYPDGVYIVARGGTLAETKTSAKGVTFDYGEGAVFGETLAISGRPSETRVTVGAEGASLIRVPKYVFLNWLHTVPAVATTVDRMALTKTLRLHLSPSLTDGALAPVLDEAEVRKFKPGEALFQEGDTPDGLHVIRKGSVTVSKNVGGREAILAYLPAGHYIGEMALISGEKRSATVRAAVHCETVMIGAGRFQEMMKDTPDLLKEVEHQVLNRLEENESARASDIGVEMADFFTRYGIGEATDILVIDEQLCIHCGNCETACAETHNGTSRLDRRAGGMIAGLHVPTSCRHCENPLCMIDCPPDAIHRNSSGEVFIDETCIGCGNCAENCPFDVIQMAQKQRPAKPGFLAWMFGAGRAEARMLRPGEGALAAMGTASRASSPRETSTAGPPNAEGVKAGDAGEALVAVKCDMCTDLSHGPACVGSCPTGAAIRMGPEAFFQVSRSRGRLTD